MDVDPDIDLINRYERMIETQIQTLESIDDKSATTFRFVAVVLGVILTGASILLEPGDSSLAIRTLPTTVVLLIGVLGLLISIGYAIITYLSSNSKYGPKSGMGTDLARYRISSNDYKNILLKNHAQSISDNRQVVRRNARRFRNSLASLFIGLVALSLGSIFLLVPVPGWLEYGLLLIVAAVGYEIYRYIVGEAYLTLAYQTRDNE